MEKQEVSKLNESFMCTFDVSKLLITFISCSKTPQPLRVLTLLAQIKTHEINIAPLIIVLPVKYL